MAYLWNHCPALLRAALHRFGGTADWKPRWYILAVPTDSFWGNASSVFSLAAPDERRECHVIRRADSDGPPPRAGTPATGRYVQKIWAEQEAKNAELRKIDYSHIPQLRVANRYAHGLKKRCRWPSTTAYRQVEDLSQSPTGPRASTSLSVGDQIQDCAADRGGCRSLPAAAARGGRLTGQATVENTEPVLHAASKPLERTVVSTF